MTELKRISIPYLYELKKKGEPISWLTAYDYPFGMLVDQAGIEMILVGDSSAMVVYGYSTTLPISMDTLIEHCRAVRRGAPNVFLVGDMPFLSYQVSVEEAIRNAGRFMKEGECDAVKLEGGVRVVDKVKGIVSAGIPVIGHIGVTPQSTSMLGGYKAQGKDAEKALALIEDAKALEQAGAFAILLESVPAKVSAIIREKTSVLIFGIGAGESVDGQLLIMHDILGLYQLFTPKFVKKYANLVAVAGEAFAHYRSDVKTRQFPQPEHTFSISPKEMDKLQALLVERKI